MLKKYPIKESVGEEEEERDRKESYVPSVTSSVSARLGYSSAAPAAGTQRAPYCVRFPANYGRSSLPRCETNGGGWAGHGHSDDH